MGGWGGEGGEGGGKKPQIRHGGQKWSTDGHDHTTRPKGDHCNQGYNSRPMPPN